VLPEFDPQLATGPIIPVANTPVPWWFDIDARELSSYLARCDYGDQTRFMERGQAWGPNLLVRKDAFLAVGGFNKKLGVFGEGRGGGEETELQNRLIAAGAKLLYVHQAAVEHLVLPKQMVFKNYLNQRYHRGISEARDTMLRGKAVPGAISTATRIGGHAAASCLKALTGRISSALDHAGACYGLYGRWSEAKRWKQSGQTKAS
jgi:GT2 family glycosyltransferase